MEFDDAELMRRFEARNLPYALWSHRLHVRVAFLYLRDLPYDQALETLRRGIQAYNAFQKIPETPTAGYNETTTQAFVRLVAATMAAYGKTLPTPDSESFCEAHPHLLCKQVLRLFYSPQQRLRPEAKYGFVEPDLAQLPPIPTAGMTQGLRPSKAASRALPPQDSELPRS